MAQQFPSRAGRKPHLHPPSAVNYYGSICGSSPKPLAHAVGQQCIAPGTLASASASVSSSASAQVELSKSTAGRGTHWPHTHPHTRTQSQASWSAVTTGISGSLTLHRCHFGQKFAPIWQFACGVKEGGSRGGGAGAASNDKVEHRTH